MTRMFAILKVALLLVLSACEGVQPAPDAGYDPSSDSLRFTGELHLRNVRQLTFGGNNAEAYWSFDDALLIFQSDWQGINPQGCDQQFVMDAHGQAGPELVSTAAAPHAGLSADGA